MELHGIKPNVTFESGALITFLFSYQSIILIFWWNEFAYSDSEEEEEEENGDGENERIDETRN